MTEHFVPVGGLCAVDWLCWSGFCVISEVAKSRAAHLGKCVTAIWDTLYHAC
jgi:hypothetical protein